MNSNEQPATPFRIGGIYRQKNGIVCRLTAHRTDPAVAYANEILFRPPGQLNSCGVRDLRTGQYPASYCKGTPDDNIALLPGELHQVDGQWVPIDCKPAPRGWDKIEGDAKPATLAESTDPRDKAMLLRDGPVKDAPKRTPSPNVPATKPGRTLHASPFAAFRSPDLTPASHLVNPLHGSAALR